MAKSPSQEQGILPAELLALAIESERIKFYRNAYNFYDQYMRMRPELASVFSASLHRCASNASLSEPSCSNSAEQSTALSIIIPVHNSESYLDQCLHSVRDQTLKNLEIIVVDDASSDDSFGIIKRHSDADSRIKVIRNKIASGSAGKPRNQALRIASGSYIGFVDSDDWVDINYFENFLAVATDSNADLVISSGFKNILESNVETRNYKNFFFNRSSGSIKTYHQSSMIWDKIYAKNFLDNFGIYLGEGPAAVDVLFNLKSYFYANKIAIADTLGYNYRRETPGSVTVVFRKRSNCDFETEAYRQVFQWIERAGVDDAYANYCRIKQLTSFIYTCKIIKIDFLAAYFADCAKALSDYDCAGFDNVLDEAKLRYLKDDFLLFRNNNISGFIRKYREADCLLCLPSGKAHIPKTVIVNSDLSPFSSHKQNGIIFAPDWSRSNQYQSLFYDSSSRLHGYNCFGLDTHEFTLENVRHLSSLATILHLHWLHPFTKTNVQAEELMNLVSYAKEKLNLSLIWTVHNLLPHEAVDPDWERNFRLQFAKMCDRLICHSQYAKNLIVHTFSVAPEKVKVIPHGKYPVASSGSDLTTQSLRTRLRLLMIGSLRPYKNVDWAINFLQKYNHELECNSQVELLICGKPVSSQQESSLKQYAQDHEWLSCELRRLSDSELYDQVVNVDFVFMPYRDMLTSGVALYALSCGRPFLAKFSETLLEVGGENSKILYRDEDDLMAILRRLVISKADGTLSAHFSSRHIATETAHLDWDKILEQDPFSFDFDR